jgi:tetratricopeptide (TPR) repeat protein
MGFVIRRGARALLAITVFAAGPLALGCATTGAPGADTAAAGGVQAASAPPARPSGPGPSRSNRAVDPDKARTHYRLGSDHLRNGRAALAIRELLAAEEYDPTDSWVQLALAEAYIHRGHLADAEAHLKRALELRPGFQEATLHLSALYIHMERYEEAAPLARALVDDPTYPQPWKALTNLGFAEFKLGRLEEARRHLQLASEYHEGYWQALLNLGILEAKDGRKLEALQHFEQVLERKPGPLAEAEVHYRMGLVYISMGNRQRALEHLNVSASKRPSGPWGKQSEEYLKRLR